MSDDDPARALPTRPPVHVETFATHYTLTWKAGSLARYVDAVRDSESVPPDATAVVDATDAAGRRRRAVRDLSAEATVRYVRLEPEPSWTVSWERRTSPTVSVSGTPTPAVCRELHTRTTACEAWSSAAIERLEAVAESVP